MNILRPNTTNNKTYKDYFLCYVSIYLGNKQQKTTCNKLVLFLIRLEKKGIHNVLGKTRLPFHAIQKFSLYISAHKYFPI